MKEYTLLDDEAALRLAEAALKRLPICFDVRGNVKSFNAYPELKPGCPRIDFEGRKN